MKLTEARLALILASVAFVLASACYMRGSAIGMYRSPFIATEVKR